MTEFKAHGGCECGNVRYDIQGPALFRAYCHCTICQAFNGADLADIIVLRNRDVTLANQDAVVFRRHRNPPLLKRGRCATCDGVAVELMTLPLLPRLTIIPAQTLKTMELAPEPLFHMFYHRRIRDIDDALPKHSGYIRSQIGFSAALLTALAGAGVHR